MGGEEIPSLRTFRGTAQQTAAHSIFPRCVARFRNGLHLYYHFPPSLTLCPPSPSAEFPPAPLSGIGQTLVHNLLRRRVVRGETTLSSSFLPPLPPQNRRRSFVTCQRKSGDLQRREERGKGATTTNSKRGLVHLRHFWVQINES